MADEKLPIPTGVTATLAKSILVMTCDYRSDAEGVEFAVAVEDEIGQRILYLGLNQINHADYRDRNIPIQYLFAPITQMRLLGVTARFGNRHGLGELAAPVQISSILARRGEKMLSPDQMMVGAFFCTT